MCQLFSEKTVIKEIAKKSIFLKRQFLKYVCWTKQPDWASVLKQNHEIWKTAIEKAQGGKKILIATSVGSHLSATILESLLAVALTLRAAETHILLCDAALPACLACWSDLYPNHKQFDMEGPKRMCGACFAPANRMYTSLGVHVHRYSSFISIKEDQWARETAKNIVFRDIVCYQWKGMAVGEHALAGTLRFFARGNLDGEPFAEQILRRYFYAALLATVASENLLISQRFETAVFHHGIYVPQGLIAEACQKHGVHVVNWNPAYRKQCFIFSHDDTYHHTMTTEPVEEWQTITWNDEKEKRLMDYLKSRWMGTEDWIWFHDKPKFELDEFIQQNNINFSKPTIGMLTSVMWDAVLHYPSKAFPNMLDWVIQTIEYFSKRSDLQLVIRIHPAEVKGTIPSRQKIADEIKNRFAYLPDNIFIIPPESNISTYAVMMQCDSVIIYNTKTGAELSAMGIPVIVAGEAWIRNKGFALDAINPLSYFQLLDRLPLGNKLPRDKLLLAKKYAYHFFFRRMIPLHYFISCRDIPYKIDIVSLKQFMIGESLGLDIICNAILTKDRFSYYIN
jgi:hypothetical protein